MIAYSGRSWARDRVPPAGTVAFYAERRCPLLVRSDSDLSARHCPPPLATDDHFDAAT